MEPTEPSADAKDFLTTGCIVRATFHGCAPPLARRRQVGRRLTMSAGASADLEGQEGTLGEVEAGRPKS
jgi:hypothetical protein